MQRNVGFKLGPLFRVDVCVIVCMCVMCVMCVMCYGLYAMIDYVVSFIICMYYLSPGWWLRSGT
jgi:hypothetical protein